MDVMEDRLAMHALHWDIVLSSVVLGRSEKEEADMNGRVGRVGNMDVVGLLGILEPLLDVF
jgi:hypothetical protein